LEQVVSFLFKYRGAIFSEGKLTFNARPSILLLLPIAGAVAFLLYFLYSRRTSGLTPISRGLLIGLRSVLIALIVFCLMRPVVVLPSVVPQSSFVAILMDDSSSMKIADENGRPRLDAIKQLISPDSRFYSALSDKFKVRIFKFSNSAERTDGAEALTGTGEQTDIAGALDQTARDMAGVPLSGIILISDGAQTANADIAATLTNLNARRVPVFTIGVGSPVLAGDIELVRATAPRKVLAGSTISAELLVRASGISSRTVRVEVTEDGHPLRTESLPLKGGDDNAGATQVAKINFKPSSPGLHRYKFTAPPIDGEPVTDNNSQEILIQVDDSHPRVLYLEGEPRWEYGKIRGGMFEEKNVVLVSLLRSADGKFYRQDVESGDELAGGFPKSEEELFKYDAIMMGSVEATFFTFEQIRQIEQFVSLRGGALLALGGAKSFDGGGYANTPMADLLPVYLTGQTVEPGESQTFKAAPSEHGRDNPVARLVDQADTNAKAWEDMPAISLPEVLTAIKPGATVILDAHSVKDRNETVPLLVEERYGRGRTLAFLASDTWRWRMMLEFSNNSFETFWRNLLRYVVQSVRRQLEASTERTFYSKGEPVRIRAEVADKKFINIEDAATTARLTAPSGRTIDLTLKQDLGRETDGYTATFVPDEDGLYKVDVTAQRGKEGGVEPAQTSFLVGPINHEAYGAAQNRDLLNRIASETGGHYYSTGTAGNLIDDITHVEGGNSVREVRDLWDMPINFLMLVGIAVAEWFIRKRKGLA
jgi:uncharacterized membrane protein